VLVLSYSQQGELNGKQARTRDRRVSRYHSVRVELGVSFEEIARLGFRLKDDPHLNVTPELIARWYEEEKEERQAGTPEREKARSKKE